MSKVPLDEKHSQPGIDYPHIPVPGCEWHISPLGRSYFVNHNNQTTSWEQPTPERPPGSLTPKYIIKDHSGFVWSVPRMGKSCSVISTSQDGSICQWTRDGKIIGQPSRPEDRRILLAPCGRSLSTFSSKFQLLSVFRDLVIGKFRFVF